MLKRIGLFALSLVLALTMLLSFIPAQPAKADTSVYNHIIPFTITDTSGVARTNVPVIITYDVNGKIVAYSLTNATATDTRIDSSGASNYPVGSGTSYNFLMATSNITCVIPSLPAYGTVTINLYTGYSPSQTSFPIIVGNNGYYTVADNSTTEPSGNFSIQSSVYVDTSASMVGQTIISKPQAIDLKVGATNNLTANIYSGGTDNVSFPTVSANATDTETTSTSHNATLPSGIATGDLLLAICATGNTAYIPYTVNTTPATGWTVLYNEVYSAVDPSYFGMAVLWKVATGTEGSTIDFSTNGTTYMVSHTYRINGYTGVPEIGNNVTGASTTPNPPSLTPSWGNYNTLWLAINCNSRTSTTLTSYSSGYIGGMYTPSTYIDVSSAKKGIRAATEDPGVITLGANKTWIAQTIAIEATPTTVAATVSIGGVSSAEHSIETRADSTLLELGVDAAISNPVWNASFEVANPPSDWSVAAGTRSQSATQKKFGAYSVAIVSVGASAGVYQNIGGAGQYNGQTLYAGAWVYAPLVGKAEIDLYDAVGGHHYSAFNTTANTSFEWLSTSGVMGAGQVQFYLWFTPDAGTAYYDGAKLSVGSSITQTTSADLWSSVALSGASVPDVSSNWTIMSNATPYMNSCNITVGGTLKASYQPTAMISGTTLPDASGNSQTGTITWGINSGMTVIGGEIMDSKSATSVGTTSAMMQGNLFFIGTYASVYLSFEYGLDTTYGYFTSETSAALAQTFAVTLTGLTPNTTYHYRALARSGSVYSYGADTTFTTAYSSSSLGSTTPLIITTGVFSGYITTGDLLICAEIINTYPPYYPTKNPADYFQMQLLSVNGTTQLGASFIVQWGDRPESIYLSPTVANTTITYGAAYIIKIANISSANITVTTNYTLTGNDWYGNDLVNLDNWCVGVATNMQNTDGTILTDPYTEAVTDYGVIITDAAGGYFTNGINGIAQVRPNLFSTAEKKNIVPTMSPAINYNAGTTLSGRVGTQISNDATTVGNIFDLTGQQFLLYSILAVVLGCIILTVSKTGGFGALGALCIAVPIIGASNYFNIMDIAIPTMLVVVFLFLFVRQFIWKTL